MNSSQFDFNDDREAFLSQSVGSNGVVIWRADLPWHQGQDGLDRHIIGFAHSGMGPEIFMASARHSYGAVRGSVYMKAAVADVCRPRSPGGDLVAVEPRVNGIFDGAIITETTGMGTVKYIGREYTHASAVYLLRIAPDDSGPERLAIAYARKEQEWTWPEAKVVLDLAFEDVVEWATRETPAASVSP